MKIPSHSDEFKAGKLLDKINVPAYLRKLSEDQITEMSNEFPQFLTDLA